MITSATKANMMDTRSCFLQTLVGLACYSQGLRDKGMKILNAFGITSSTSHIREHGSWWARIRKAIMCNPFGELLWTIWTFGRSLLQKYLQVEAI